MTWEISMAWRGELEKFRTAELKAGQQAVTTIIRRRTTNMKNDLRRQIRKAKLSDRLGKTVRGDVYPKRGSSLNAAGVVRSAAITKRANGIVDIITVLDEGAVIKARAGRFLAFPISPRVKGRGVKGDPVSRSPASFPAGSFIFKPSRNGNGVLVFASNPTEVAFVLVRQVRLKKRIDIDKAYAKAIRNIEDAIAQQWERNDTRVQTRFEVNL